MFDHEVGRIHSILSNILGEAKNEGYSNGWRSYNCPYCADMENIRSDNKFNLETNVENGCVFHCWKCETRGKLSRLISDFGTPSDLAEYRSELKTIRESSLYQLSKFDANDDISNFENYIELPNGFKRITGCDRVPYAVLNYLHDRSVTDDIIEKYGIGFTDWDNEEFSLRSRVIIPSYDCNGDLNYWVARDYTGRNKVKYKNPTIQKTSVIFNEKFVNWYEDVNLVEGPFDHIVVPNSIPLLGKVLKRGYILYDTIMRKAHANVNVLLDDDAYEYACRTYKLLDNGRLKGKVRVVKCPDGYDASLINEKFGKRGIIQLLRRAEKLSEYDLLNVR